MSKLVSTAVATLASVALTGCLDLEQEITLNPDGSGKISLRAAFVPVPFVLMGAIGREEGDGQKPEEILKQGVREFLMGTQGVEAWRDVRYEVLPDGRFSLQAKGYFKDLSEVRILSSMLEIPLFKSFSLSSSAGGDLVLEALSQPGPAVGLGAPRRPGAGGELSEEQIRVRVKMEKAVMEQFRPVMEGVCRNLRLKMRFLLPGPLQEVSLFRRAGEEVVELEFKGEEFLKAWDGMTKDEDFIRDRVRNGAGFFSGGAPDLDVLEEKMFGGKGPARAVLRGGGRPRFDYAAELAEARKESEELRRRLGVGEEAAEPMPEPEEPALGERNPEVLLRDVVCLDLLGTGPLLASSFEDEAFRVNLIRCLAGASYGFELRVGDDDNSSFSSKDRARVRLIREETGASEVEIRRGGEPPARLTILQDAGKGELRLALTDPGRDLEFVLVRRKDGRSTLAGIRGGRAFTASWDSLAEALRRDPATLGEMFLAPLKEFPLDVRPTPADPLVIDLCLKPPPGKEAARRVKGCRDRMASDEAQVREKATEELQRMVSEDLAALRVVLDLAGEEKDPEIRERLLGLARSGKESARAVEYVLERGLDRDLVYLAGLMGSADPARAGAARARLAALAGREFGTREEFEAWHREQGERLIWDPAAGRYRLRE